jgi:hypothetical protein
MSSNKNIEIITSRFNAITDGLTRLSADLVLLKQDVLRLETGQQEYIEKTEKELVDTTQKLVDSVNASPDAGVVEAKKPAKKATKKA